MNLFGIILDHICKEFLHRTPSPIRDAVFALDSPCFGFFLGQSLALGLFFLLTTATSLFLGSLFLFFGLHDAHSRDFIGLANGSRRIAFMLFVGAVVEQVACDFLACAVHVALLENAENGV